jgi:hypothetical protein
LRGLVREIVPYLQNQLQKRLQAQAHAQAQAQQSGSSSGSSAASTIHSSDNGNKKDSNSDYSGDLRVIVTHLEAEFTESFVEQGGEDSGNSTCLLLHGITRLHYLVEHPSQQQLADSDTCKGSLCAPLAADVDAKRPDASARQGRGRGGKQGLEAVAASPRVREQMRIRTRAKAAAAARRKKQEHAAGACSSIDVSSVAASMLGTAEVKQKVEDISTANTLATNMVVDLLGSGSSSKLEPASAGAAVPVLSSTSLPPTRRLSRLTMKLEAILSEVAGGDFARSSQIPSLQSEQRVLLVEVTRWREKQERQGRQEEERRRMRREGGQNGGGGPQHEDGDDEDSDDEDGDRDDNTAGAHRGSDKVVEKEVDEEQQRRRRHEKELKAWQDHQVSWCVD